MKRYCKFFTSLALSFWALPVFADVIPNPADPRPYVPIDYTKKYWEDTIDLGQTIVFYFLATLLFELPIMYWFGFRSRRSILAVVVANFISVPVLQISLAYGYSALILEALVVLIEFAIIKFMLRDMPWNKLLLALVTANIFSAVVGTLVLSYFNLF